METLYLIKKEEHNENIGQTHYSYTPTSTTTNSCFVAKKEEDFETDRVTKLIKTESGFSPKFEEIPTPPMMPTFNQYSYAPFTNPFSCTNQFLNPPMFGWPHKQFETPFYFPQQFMPPFMGPMSTSNPLYNQQHFLPPQQFPFAQEAPKLKHVKAASMVQKNKPIKFKPFKIIKEKRPLMSIIVKKEEATVEKKPTLSEKSIKDNKMAKKTASRLSACKNYISLLCTGFSREIVTADKESDLNKQLQSLITERKMKYKSTRDLSDTEVDELIKIYVSKMMCGKKIKRQNGDRECKVRSTLELENLIEPQDKDRDSMKLVKEILKEMIMYFFGSEYYDTWLAKALMSSTSRLFFMKNRKEIKKKFADPTYYKPRFDIKMGK